MTGQTRDILGNKWWLLFHVSSNQEVKVVQGNKPTLPWITHNYLLQSEDVINNDDIIFAPLSLTEAIKQHTILLSSPMQQLVPLLTHWRLYGIITNTDAEGRGRFLPHSFLLPIPADWRLVATDVVTNILPSCLLENNLSIIKGIDD